MAEREEEDTTTTSSSERDVLLERQRQEVKSLRAKIQSMKKGIPKGDKKRRKEVTAEIARMEDELQERHKQELSKCVPNSSGEMAELEGEMRVVRVEGDGVEEDGKKAMEQETGKKSCAQKRREKKALQELEKQQRREEEEREMALVGNPRLREREKLEALLESLQLKVIDIQPDGNCLYAAISDQLSRKVNIEASVSKLRTQCADYVRSHSTDFLPFTTDPKTGELFTEDQFAQYCSDIEGTSAWGGQLEIRALSHVYQVTITVYQAESPPIVVGEEYDNSLTSLTLSYHHHEYGLGEHYNSLAPIFR